jgi:hypothetical protein
VTNENFREWPSSACEGCSYFNGEDGSWACNIIGGICWKRSIGGVPGVNVGRVIDAVIEACAVAAESWVEHYPTDVFPVAGRSIGAVSARARRHAARQIAAAIRARGMNGVEVEG